jgi:hypothetical protein
MFRQLDFRLTQLQSNGSSTLPPPFPRGSILDMHPADLVEGIEYVYQKGRDITNIGSGGRPEGFPNYRSNVKENANIIATKTLTLLQSAHEFPIPTLGRTSQMAEWQHLIYAYMIENTRIYEIFRRVLHEFLHGEKFGTPFADAQNWLRTTEELFYRDSAPFLATSVSSYIRPDIRANRRNAYHRMFGMDLNHGADDGKAYSYLKADAANSDFANTFEELLREVWIAITYVGATSSANPKDDSKIVELCEKLNEMLRSRRLNGNLAREELTHVSAMSWFHLTIEFDSPIVRSLRAEAAGPEQRLFKIAERVGLPAHGLAKSFIDIADDISNLLILIEAGTFTTINSVEALYTPPPAPATSPTPVEMMRNIITHWTAITGRDVKARKIASG